MQPRSLSHIYRYTAVRYIALPRAVSIGQVLLSRDRFVALIRLKSLFSMTFGRELLKALGAEPNPLSACVRSPGRASRAVRVVQNEVLQRPEPRHARPSLDARFRGHDTDVSESSPAAEDSTRNPRDQLIKSPRSTHSCGIASGASGMAEASGPGPEPSR